MPTGEVTELLLAWSGGRREALDELLPLVYDELRRIAHRELRGERPGGMIRTTALVHEAYLRLVDQKRARIESRYHFLGLAAQLMRRILIDEARRRRAGKRGAGTVALTLDDVNPAAPQPDDNLLALDEALTLLSEVDDGLARVVELRYFGGLALEEVAEVQNRSRSSVWRDWQTARAWLFEALGPGPAET
jgi:RNA polymerase sigma factor (TIGR02999 family)